MCHRLYCLQIGIVLVEHLAHGVRETGWGFTEHNHLVEVLGLPLLKSDGDLRDGHFNYSGSTTTFYVDFLHFNGFAYD